MPKRGDPKKKILYVTDDPFERDPVQHNYVQKIQDAVARDLLVGLGLFQAHINHDDKCRIYDARPCNCNCEVVIESESGKTIKL